jgi:Mce-associated membrane protein
VTRRRAVPAVLAVLVLLAAIGVGFLAADRWRADEREQARTDGLAAARARTEQVLTFDAATLDADIDRSRQVVAGPFADSYDRIARGLLGTYGREQGTRVRTTVTRAGVSEVRDGDRGPEVVAVLWVDQQLSSTAAPQPTTSSPRLRVTVTRVLGQWLITDLVPV